MGLQTGLTPRHRDHAATTHGDPDRAEGADTLSVVVPCFNEADGLGEAHERLTRACQEAFPAGHQIVLVDDGSRDETWARIRELAAADDRVTGIRLSRNFGHQAAILAGLSAVTGSLILIIDADLQDPPELLPAMRELMRAENADVVYGRRKLRSGDGIVKRATAKLFYRCLSLASNVDIPRDTGDFRLMTRRIGDLLLTMPERDRFTRGMVAWLGFRQVPFEYDRAARVAGASAYSVRKMLRLASDAFLGFSLLPLRFAMLIAGLCCLLSIGVIVFTLWAWLTLDTVPGWTSEMIFVSLVASAQFAVLGIIGEYVGRIYLQDKQRPAFIIAEATSPPAGDD